MKKLPPAMFLAFFSLLHAADDRPDRPGFFGRVWQSTKSGANQAWGTTKAIGGKTVDAAKSPFQRGDSKDADGKAGWRRLAMTMRLEPPVVKIGETRMIDVTVGIANTGKEPVQLDFPNSQRIDVLVKDEGGKVLSRWSDDQRLDREPSFVLINPGEKIEYAARVSTREMTPGKSYTIQGILPSHDRLHLSRTVMPER